MSKKRRTSRFVDRTRRAQGGAQQDAASNVLARERVKLLLDEGSFEELDLLVEPYVGTQDRGRLTGDGVVVGFGRIHGRDICIFSQDFAAMQGRIGLAQAMKICKAIDLGIRIGVPVVGFYDSQGFRVQEGIESAAGFAEICWRGVQASGRIPQISAVLGPCFGGLACSPAVTDFTFMVETTSHMVISHPELVSSTTGENIDLESLGGALTHGRRSGACHFVAGSEQDCFRQIKDLLSYLPSNGSEKPRSIVPSDSPDRRNEALERIAELPPTTPYEVQDVIREIADDRSFCEVHRHFAENLIIGFIRLGGEVIGVIANNPAKLAGALDISASEKGARFIRFCDAFNIPILTLADTPGYMPGLDQEHGGIIRHGAKLVFAYCEATVGKVTVILRKAYGGAYGMGAKQFGVDLNFAWPSAEIAVMGPPGAVEILFNKEVASAPDPNLRRKELAEQYRREFCNPYRAASRGYIDEVIAATDTRAKLIRAFRFLAHKGIAFPKKRHDNIPL
ncbi:MAG: acyl-CoA carboxylase subunit beta [Elusimicrobia bacterium]|nr:acyl-CoA carboxylase subunit beta [Elusimicrobiota bacterium]